MHAAKEVDFSCLEYQLMGGIRFHYQDEHGRLDADDPSTTTLVATMTCCEYPVRSDVGTVLYIRGSLGTVSIFPEVVADDSGASEFSWRGSFPLSAEFRDANDWSLLKVTSEVAINTNAWTHVTLSVEEHKVELTVGGETSVVKNPQKLGLFDKGTLAGFREGGRSLPPSPAPPPLPFPPREEGCLFDV